MAPTCKTCNKAFGRNGSLYRHQRDKHSSATPRNYCVDCNASFGRPYDLERHKRERRVHGRRLSPSCPSAPRHRIQSETNQNSLRQSSARTVTSSASNPTPLNGQNTIRRRTKVEASPWICSICHHRFAVHDRDTAVLFKHLKTHFSATVKRYRCEECQIDFAFEPDLRIHQKSAEQGHCGFGFCDQGGCTGHHAFGRDHVKMLDIVRKWDQYQLQAYINSVEILGNKSIGDLFTVTEPSGSFSCKACKIFSFFDKAFPDDHSDCYTKHLKSHRIQSTEQFDTEQNMFGCETDSIIRTLTERRCRSLSVEPDLSDQDSFWDPRKDRLRDSKRIKHAMSNLQDGAFIDTSYLSNPLQGTLHWSASIGDWKTVEDCISRGADVFGVDLGGRTAVHWAAASGSTQTLDLLLARGGAVDAKDTEDETPLHVAIEYRKLDCVDLLLGYGADAEAANSSKKTCLRLGAESGVTAIVELLLKHNCDFEAKDQIGRTPLFGATTKGSFDSVRALCNRGANVNYSSEYDRPLLKFAIDAKNFRIADYFLQRGALVTADMIPFARRRGADEEFIEQLQRRTLRR